MNWLTNYVRPKLRAVLGNRKETPENLWDKCQKCGQMIYHKEFKANLHVCGHCGHHHRIGPELRLASLFDAGQYRSIELPEVPSDPLKFRDQKRYADRLKENRAKTGQNDALNVAFGTMGGNPVVMAVQNFAFMAGSMGAGLGEAFVAAARHAVKKKAAFIVITAAGGARMQEGILSLMQMPRTTVAVQMVRDAGLPYLVVLTDPTTGGVTASYAMLGDVQISEPGALIGFAGPRVIENTIRENLPEGFQRAEYLLEHGMLDMVVHRSELRDTLTRIIDLLTRPTLSDRVPTPLLGNPGGRSRAATNA
ncbi:MAG: acetyl-CoA carboxylase, carboxyltransferase subunit beta [Sphingomonadales bacterium]